MNTSENVRRHYSGEGLLVRITAVLDDLPAGALKAASDAGFDHFHIRGMAASSELAQLAGIESSMRVLDAGSGFGGPARYIARTFGAHVVGVDLTPEFVAVSELLARRLGIEELVTYQVGDIAGLSFKDASFDMVWTQHVVMNVRDRDAVYREMRRVLKPGGRLAFYDVVAGNEGMQPHYPVPWADSTATSFLLNEAETIAALERAGFAVEQLRDVSEDAIAWFAQPQPAIASALTLTTLLGPRAGPMTQNFARNLREGRVRVVMGICRTTPTGA